MDAVLFIYNLLPLWTWIIVGLWVYCNIGFRFAEHKIYVADNPDVHPWIYLCYWPVFGLQYKFEKTRPVTMEGLAVSSEKAYKFWMMLIWPSTVAWNIVAILTIGMMLATEFLLDKFIRILTWGRVKPLSRCK